MKLILLRNVSLILLLQFIYCFSYGQNWDKVIKAVANDQGYLDLFGYSVSVSGNYAVVGAPGVQTDATGQNALLQAGAAYILYNDGTSWKQVKKIVAPARSAGDYFGSSVAISGNYFIVGAKLEDEDALEGNSISNAGSAYIYEKDLGGVNAWGLASKVTAPERNASSNFGYSVAINGDYVIVGSPFQNISSDISLNSPGAAYIFKRKLNGQEGWGSLRTLIASDRSAQAGFGNSVSINGTYAVVGSSNESRNNESLSLAGSAYIFKKNQNGLDNWLEVQKIVAPTPHPFDLFGISVAVTDEFIIVGANGVDTDANEENYVNNAGAVYVFKYDSEVSDNWRFTKMITASVRGTGDFFGMSVALNGNYILVGCQYHDLGAQDDYYLDGSGAAYLFFRNYGGNDTWGQMKKFTASQRHSATYFGISVAMTGKFIVVGASQEQSDANYLLLAGSSYFFSSDTPLPVALTSFDATKNEKNVLLQWSTSSEMNADYFEIQRSRDGQSWIAISMVVAASKSESLKNYSFLDKDPGSGVNLYRLKMVDLDQSFAFSRIRSVFTENIATFPFYPNPASDRIFVSESLFGKISSVKITNSLGQLVSNLSNVQQEISIQGLSAGLYSLQIKYFDGQLISKKMVVVK